MTELFDRNKIEDAIAKTLRDYARRSTDYGQAFEDFKKNCASTTWTIAPPSSSWAMPATTTATRTEILKEMYDRCKRLIWLNPESRNTWNVGDAEMRRNTWRIATRLKSATASCIWSGLSEIC